MPVSVLPLVALNKEASKLLRVLKNTCTTRKPGLTLHPQILHQIHNHLKVMTNPTSCLRDISTISKYVFHTCFVFYSTSYHSPRFQLTEWNTNHVLVLELMCAMSCPSITPMSDGILQNQPENGPGYTIKEEAQAGVSIDVVRIRLLLLGNYHV